ncbi:MAG: YdeI/OmpD-associated family protein [Bacteroidota bacterium]
MPIELKDGIKAFHAKSRKQWRDWLTKNHGNEKSVWLILYSKEAGITSVSYPEAVEEGLCFGWIDSKVIKRDENSRYQSFSPRKPKSRWSQSNKDRVEKLLSAGLMEPAGLAAVVIAKETGTWDALNEVDKLLVPDDLQLQFNNNPAAFTHWQKFSPSSRKTILEWILNAKRPDTRKKRVDETVRLATDNIKAHVL